MLSGAAGLHAAETSARCIPDDPPAAAAGDGQRSPETPGVSARRSGSLIRVGPREAVRTLQQAAVIARDGDRVEVQAATYAGDVSVWTQSDLEIRGVGGRPVIDALGKSAEDKGTLVIKGTNVSIENLELRHAAALGANGAGIRMEGLRLSVRNVIFRDNEEGILTYDNPAATLEVRNSQFIHNGYAYARGFSHAIYVGRIGRLTFEENYSTRTESGHLLKSRACRSTIRFNRLTDEGGGSSSYQIDLPNGGDATIVGNMIEKGLHSENTSVIAYGAERLGIWPNDSLEVSFNTIVNRRHGECHWLHAREPARVRFVANVLIGTCGVLAATDALVSANSRLPETALMNAEGYDFRLIDPAKHLMQGPGSVPIPTVPARTYSHPAQSAPRGSHRAVPGAFDSP